MIFFFVPKVSMICELDKSGGILIWESILTEALAAPLDPGMTLAN